MSKKSVAFLTLDWAKGTNPIEPNGCAWYRCKLPSEQLVRHDWTVGFAIPEYSKDLEFGAYVSKDMVYYGWDIVVFKLIMLKSVAEILEKKKPNQKIVVDIDDFYEGLHETNLAYSATDPEKNSETNREHYWSIIDHADAIITSTQFLYDFYTALGSYTKPGGAWYVWHADSEGANFRQAMKDSGIMVKQCLIWVKNSMVLGRQDYQWKHEPCLYGWKEGAAHYFTNERTHTTVIEDKIDVKKLTKDEMKKMLTEILSDKNKTTVINCDKPFRNAEHPTMKPILLLAPLIKNSSKENQLVADGFLGSGSTMVASHQLKRKCYGMELDPKYCDVIVKRMLNLDDTLTVKRNGVDVTNEWK